MCIGGSHRSLFRIFIVQVLCIIGMHIASRPLIQYIFAVCGACPKRRISRGQGQACEPVHVKMYPVMRISPPTTVSVPPRHTTQDPSDSETTTGPPA